MMKADLQFWMTTGIFLLTCLAAFQRFMQWREQRRNRQLQERQVDDDDEATRGG